MPICKSSIAVVSLFHFVNSRIFLLVFNFMIISSIIYGFGFAPMARNLFFLPIIVANIQPHGSVVTSLQTDQGVQGSISGLQ